MSERDPQAQAGRTLFLVDAMALLFRAHFAFVRRPLTTSAGLPVGALYGFLNALLAVIRDEKARYVAVALDTPGPTFRHERFDGYKAHRPEMPSDLALQVPLMRQAIEAMGLKTVSLEGVEADDLIASLSRRAEEEGWDVVVVSADKDFGQLIRPGLRQYVPARGPEPARWIDATGFHERYGIAPEQFVDYLALIGDASDNIPGVPGIGPKTAAELLRAHGTLDGVLAALDTIEPLSVRRRLAAGRESALLSRELARLRSDLPVEPPEEFGAPDPGSRAALREMLADLEFRALERRLFPGGPTGGATEAKGKRPGRGGPGAPEGPGRGESSAPAAAERGHRAPSPETGSRPGATQGSLLDSTPEVQPGPAGRSDGSPRPPRIEVPCDRADAAAPPASSGWGGAYALVANAAQLGSALADFPRGGSPSPLALALVRSGEPPRETLAGIAFGWRAGRMWYASAGHRPGPNVEDAALVRLLGPLLADSGVPKTGRDLALGLPLLERLGLRVAGPLEDGAVAAYVRDPESPLKLRDLARQRLGHRMIEVEDLCGHGRARVEIADLAPASVVHFACEQADAALRLAPLLDEELRACGGWRLYREVEMPLVPVLGRMMAAGVLVDPQVLAGMGETLAAEMHAQEAEIHRLAGGRFNVNSPKQFQEVLFERLKLKPRARTQTGFSTSQAVLEELAERHPLPAAVIAYRQLAKLKSAYVDALPRLIDPATGRIHARFHQTVTATGRLSSSDPNLQNIPVRSALGRQIRRAFVAPPGALLLAADYSQIELRVLAHLSGDEYLVGAFRQGADIHRATAARVAGIAEEAVTPEMRARAKTVNFGVIYGMGAQRLAAQLGIPVAEATAFIEEYFARLPGVKGWIDACVARAREAGYAETILGRRRYLPDLRSDRPRERAAAERMAMNTTVQGSAADLIKLAMVRLDVRLGARAPRARLLLQVHDELLFEVPEGEAQAIGEEVRAEMEAVLALAVPLRVTVSMGANWFEAHG